MTQAERVKKIRAERIAAGLCYRCGGPLPEGHTNAVCLGCRVLMAERERERYLAMRKADICVLCRGASRPGKALCQACADRVYAKRRAAKG